MVGGWWGDGGGSIICAQGGSDGRLSMGNGVEGTTTRRAASFL